MRELVPDFENLNSRGARVSSKGCAPQKFSPLRGDFTLKMIIILYFTSKYLIKLLFLPFTPPEAKIFGVLYVSF